jgi:hypothetical protein
LDVWARAQGAAEFEIRANNTHQKDTFKKSILN